VSRNPKIEAIISLWFEADHCAPALRAENRKKRDTLIRQYIGDNPFTVEQVLDTLHAQYQEYRKERRLTERLSGGQQASKTT
jgi:DNA-dependent RNA polymerase auxiliary subunit epsilon